MDCKNFETMLEDQQKNSHIGSEEDIVGQNKKQELDKQTADKNASMFDLVKMVAKLVTKTMNKKYDVTFKMDEGSRPILDPIEKLEGPQIYYQVISRKPIEKKPRQRDVFKERTEDNSDRFGTMLGQKFKCIIQFDVMAPKSVNKSIDEVMTNFEDMLLSYTHYFKKNGVAEFYFDNQMTDHNLDAYRQVFSVRSLQYYVEIEKLIKTYDGEIFDVTSD